MKRISVSKSPTAAPSKSETSSIKTHPPTANAWPPISSRAYQGVPSPKSLAWAGPYASGRTHSTPTSIPTEPATHRTEAINRHYRTGQTHRQRLPQPHQLPTPNAPPRRRPRRLHPHPTMKSPSTESASMMNGSTSARVAPPVSTFTCSQRDADRGVGAHLATNGGISRARRLDHSR